MASVKFVATRKARNGKKQDEKRRLNVFWRLEGRRRRSVEARERKTHLANISK